MMPQAPYRRPVAWRSIRARSLWESSALGLFVIPLVACASIVFAPSVQAESGLQMRPLIYREKIEPGKTLKGKLDISNPTNEKIAVKMSVKLFRQVDDKGTLEFYDKPDATAGIKPEFTDFELNPKDALRLVFSIDGTKLPEGDVFAAIFATTQPPKVKQTAIVPAVQVGTLLVLQNGQAGPRTIEMSDLNLPTFQIGSNEIKGSVKLKNPADPQRPTGFFPTVEVSVSPWGANEKFEAPLVYAGRTRTVDITIPSDQFGIYQVAVASGGAHETKIVFMMTGKWLWLGPLLVVGVIAVIVALIVLVARHRRARSLPYHHRR